MATTMRKPKRHWLAPEVVQTSAMDCGPAALKCVLEGFGIASSYGRLREACQTSVDGTSIDALESVANQLGLIATQKLLPMDTLFLKDQAILPSIIVVSRADGSTHFAVVWQSIGPWLQVMDPAIGRRWVRFNQFKEEILRHELRVPERDWCDWAHSAEFLEPLRERMRQAGLPAPEAQQLITQATHDPGWFSLGTLDATVRLVSALIEGGGVKPGREATSLMAHLFHHTTTHADDIFSLLPQDYWSVLPDPTSTLDSGLQLLLKGAVLIRLEGRHTQGHASADLSAELQLVISEKPQRPLSVLWRLLKIDGILSPLAVMGATGIAAMTTLVEALLFRGLFDLGGLLNQASQRLMAVLCLLAFIILGLAIRLPIITETLRLGRALDARLRIALLRKLPLLTDRYFQSRPISDMADRSHSIHMTRQVPGMGIQFIQSLGELALTFLGVLLIDPGSAVTASLVVIVSIMVPTLLQPMINERDLRVRNHAGALTGFYLDALLGLVPIRTHRAETSVQRLHESLLVQWTRSGRRLIRMTIVGDGLQSILCLGLVGLLLFQHFMRSGGVTGADLLLVYWALKLPAIGQAISGLAHQYPIQRNIMLRLLEPLTAPEELEGQLKQTAEKPLSDKPPAMALALTDVHVVAGGHSILEAITLSIAAGEHLAIVGRSGAGKSTLVGLLLGWHKVSSGHLTVDGTPLDAALISQIRRETAWVDPAIQIWNQPLLDNLVYSADNPAMEAVSSAVDEAHLRGVLQRLPQGFQTELGEGGALISGGEGQRVRLGRALIQDRPRLVLLDEPFRGMDREQRSQLLQQARERWSDVTLICVSHDISETRSFPRVLVVEDGRILEDGNPAQLAARPSRYRELLDAETVLHQTLWDGADWRHLRIQGGQVA